MILLQAIIKLFMLLAHWTPSPIYRGGSWLLAHGLFFCNSKSVRVVSTNLSLCFPEKTEQQRRQLALGNLTNHFFMSKQAACAWVGSRTQIESKFKRVEGKSLVDQRLDRPTNIPSP